MAGNEDDFYAPPTVVDFAYQIVDMDLTIKRQKKELERLKDYERKYNELLNESIKHSQKMVGNLVDVLMTPGVPEAFAAAKEKCTYPHCECQNGRAVCGKQLQHASVRG